MLKGYMGKIVCVDLSRRESKAVQLDESICSNFLGGYGIGAKLLYDFQKPNTDRLNPESIIGFNQRKES